MTTPLLNEFALMELSEVEGLNVLTEAGVISDNAVTVDDIALADLERATEFMKGWPF